jgi:hypothetical protein
MSEERISYSPYNYVSNNPIIRIDPNGMLDGDYYSATGEHLGSDGIDDDKVYIQDSNGTKSFGKGVLEGGGKFKELAISHKEFQTIASIVKHEAGTANPDENLWIAHTANNAANKSGTSLYKKLMSGYSSAWSAKVPLSTTSNSSSSCSARAGVLDVLSGGPDPTGGSTFWDGTDFLAWGLNSPYGNSHAKFRQYKSISISNTVFNNYLSGNQQKYTNNTVKYSGVRYDIPASVFNTFVNWSNRGFNYNTGKNRKYGLEATGAFGHSIFWKKTQ